MPRRLRKLLGLSKVEVEHGYEASKQTPTVASVTAVPLSAGYGAVDGAKAHNAPSRADDTDGGTLPQSRVVDSNTTRSLGQTCSYWERAAKQLEDKEPSVFAALQELGKESSRTSKDLPSEISQIIEHHRNAMENKQWSLPFKVRGREVKIRAQLDNVWKALQTFNAVGCTLASLDPVHAGIPWAGVSFIVQGALNDSAQNISAMEGLSRISPIVDRYLLMEMIYLGVRDRSRHENFEKYLVDLYASILKYQVAAACCCKRSTLSRFLRNLPKVDDWAGMLKDIDNKDIDCKGLASVFDSLEQRRQNSTLQSIFQELDKRFGNMQSMMQGNERESARAENARILSWICDYIPGRDHQDVMVHKKMGTQYAHSGQWLLDHDEFCSWRLGEDQRLSTLWVYGSVGTGKTSLVSRIMEWHLQRLQPETAETYRAASLEDHVEQRIRQADPEYFGSVAYFYCVRQGQDQSGTDPAVILRSLVRQLAWLSDGSSISPPIRTFYDKWRYERPGSGRLSLEECSGLLTELVSSYSNTSSYSSTTIILDALDECEKPYELLRALKTIANASTGKIKLFVSSRLNVKVCSVLIPRSKIDIQSQGTSKDMDIFLHTEVKKGDRCLLKGNFPNLEDRLIEVLRDRAQGMFRWAELQPAIFLDENSPFRLAEDVISKLDRLEVEVGLPDLDLVYDEIHQINTRVGTHDRENVIKTFKFLLCSFVEWSLHDLATAISLDVKGKLNLAVDASYVLDICSNFLVVDHSGYVQFAHLSVPEYLKGGRSAVVFSDMDAHAQIAEVCLAAQEIVKKREFDRRQVLHRHGRPLTRWERRAIAIPTADPSYGGMLRDDPLSLHMYAFALCLEHCELASIVKSQKGSALFSLFTTFMSFVEVNAPFLTWIQQKHEGRIRVPGFPRNWTAQIGFSHYRSKKLQTKADPQDTFFAACAYGCTEILRDMMRSDVNVDVNRRNEKGAPGIGVASRYGHFSVVELLLNQGAEVDIWVNRHGFTPLYEAGVRGHSNIVALLLSRGADVSARFKGCHHRFYDHDGSDSEEGKNDEDDEDHINGLYNRINEADETLLHAIAHYEWRSEPMDELKMSSIVSSLLKHGASVEAINPSSETPLHRACRYNNSLVVSILLHHGASLGALDEEGYTPLMRSATNGSTAALELILKKVSIADIVYRDSKEGHSALSLSLQCFKPDTTMLLLNTVDLRAARELGTQEGDEFVELADILKRIGCDILIDPPVHDIADNYLSQRSAINCLQAIAEKIVMGKVDWHDADLRNKLWKEGVDWVDVWSDLANTTSEEEEADADDNDGTDDGNGAEDEDGTDEEDDTDDDNNANDDNIHDDDDKDYEDL